MGVLNGLYEMEVQGVALDATATFVFDDMVNAGLVFHPQRVSVRVTTAMTGIPVCTVSVGSNAPDYDNVASGISVGLMATNAAKETVISTQGTSVSGIVGVADVGTPVGCKIHYTTGTGGIANVSLVGYQE